MDTPELILPHLHIGKRLFVLEPLAEIDPEFTAPVTGLTIAEMVERLQQSFGRGESPKQEITKSSW